jgi:hypothetical protein
MATYAGYVAWRLWLISLRCQDETASVLTDRFTFSDYPNLHILDYPVSGKNDAVAIRRRRYNWSGIGERQPVAPCGSVN